MLVWGRYLIGLRYLFWIGSGRRPALIPSDFKGERRRSSADVCPICLAVASGADCTVLTPRSRPVFDGCEQIIAFFGEEGRNSRFVGVYDVGARLPSAESPTPAGCPHPEWAAANHF